MLSSSEKSDSSESEDMGYGEEPDTDGEGSQVRLKFLDAWTYLEPNGVGVNVSLDDV